MNPYAEYDNFDINDPANERYTTLSSARTDPGVPIAGCGSCGDIQGFGETGDGSSALFLFGIAAVLYFALR